MTRAGGRHGDRAPDFAEYRRSRDRAMRDRLVDDHTGLAERAARRFRHRGESLDDLIQVALLGLLKAVERFDPTRGVPFPAFALPTIEGELKRHFRDAAWAVRLPRSLQELAGDVYRATASLTQELQRSPTVEELATRTGHPAEAVIEAMEANRAFVATSLDAGGGGGADRGRRNRLGAHDPGLEAVEHQLLLDRLLSGLPPRQRRIVELRFYGELTQAEIAEEVGVSQMHVSRLLARALEALRDVAETT